MEKRLGGRIKMATENKNKTKTKTGSNLLKDLPKKTKTVKKKKVENENDSAIKKVKAPKKIKQSFKEGYGVYITDTLVFRIRKDNEDVDVIKKFDVDISFNKEKIGKKTKYPDGVERTIIDVITDEKDLVYVLQV